MNRGLSKRELKAEKFKDIGVFNLKTARSMGVSHQTLLRMMEDGFVERLRRDIYIHVDSSLEPEDEDFAVACLDLGSKSVVGGLSALAYYNLTEVVPQQLWIFVTHQKQSQNSLYRVIRTNADLKIGVIMKKYFRISSVERAIVESFRHHGKIGEDLVLSAARNAIRNKLTSAEKILEMARKLGFEKYITTRWGALNVE